MLKRLQRQFGITGELAAILVVMGLTTLSMSLPNPVLPLYLKSIDISAAVTGTMLSVGMLGMAIGETGWGYLADRFGSRLAFITGTFLTGLSVLLFVFTQNVPAIFGIFFLWGFLRSAVFGPVRGYIANAAPPGKIATYMAFSAVMLSASSSLGGLPSGFLVSSFGYHSVFYTSLGFSIIAGLVAVTCIRHKNAARPAEISEEAAEPPAPEEHRFSLLSLTPMCLVTALRFFGMGSLMTFIPLFADEKIGISVELVGVLFTVGGLANLAMSIPMGILADRLGKKNVMTAGMVVSAAAMAGTAFAGNFGMLVLFMVLNNVGMALFSPAALGLLSDSVPRNRQSTAMGFYGGVCENVGILGGSALGGVIWDAINPEATFFAGAVACGIGALLCMIWVKNVKAGQQCGCG
jgi:MFS family permease